jgi:hypothetical protein
VGPFEESWLFKALFYAGCVTEPAIASLALQATVDVLIHLNEYYFIVWIFLDIQAIHVTLAFNEIKCPQSSM